MQLMILNMIWKIKKFYFRAGGVVPSIIFALNKMKVSKIILSNRTKAKAEQLQNMFKNITVVDWGEIPDFDMIINATSVGLNKDDNLNLDFSKIGKNKFFYDVIYNPKETNFLKKGKDWSIKLKMERKCLFIKQQQAFKLWHGIQPRN